MKLLDPSEIKADKQQNLEDARIRTNRLAVAESQLAKEVNVSRELATIEIESINNEVKEYRNKILSEKAVLETEISQLQEKRDLLLKPIDELREEIKADAEAVSRDRDQLEHARKDVEADKEKNRIFEKSLTLKAIELENEKRKLQKRELNIEHIENLQLENAQRLGVEWSNYHLATSSLNDREKVIKIQEESIRIREISIENRKVAQDVREGEIKNGRKELQSGYQALEQAKIHLGIKT